MSRSRLLSVSRRLPASMAERLLAWMPTCLATVAAVRPSAVRARRSRRPSSHARRVLEARATGVPSWALAIGSTVAVLNPMDAGRLRAALREAIELYARLDGATREGAPTPRRHPGPSPIPHREVPAGRHAADAAPAGPVLLHEDDDEPT